MVGTASLPQTCIASALSPAPAPAIFPLSHSEIVTGVQRSHCDWGPRGGLSWGPGELGTGLGPWGLFPALAEACFLCLLPLPEAGGPIRPMSVKCFEVSPAKHLQMHHLSTGRRDQLGWGQGRTVGGGEVESSRTALLAESFPSLPFPALAQLQAQEASPL